MDFSVRLESVGDRVQKAGKDATCTNQTRRRLHAEVSLLELDLEEDALRASPAVSADIRAAHHETLTALAQGLDLKFVRRAGLLTAIVDFLDEVMRIAAVWLFLVDSAFILAVPAVILDLVYPRQRLTTWAKQFVGHTCLQLSAVFLTVTGITPKTFGSDVRLICFSHASTMDAFSLSAAVPVRHYSVAKSILFSIPFFSWHLAAYGGVAINRSDKEQAISALAAAAASAREGDCVAVAPEGTRSTTGQLLPFKKGPFYLWQSLDSASVIPVVIYGGYELYPPGKQMSLPGRVVMEFLEPIHLTKVDGEDTPANRRERMSRQVRRSMLEALKKAPVDVGDTSPVSLADRGGNLLAILAIFAFNYLVVNVAWKNVQERNISVGSFGLGFVGVSLMVTLLLFCYKVYVQPKMAKSKAKSS